MNLYKILLISAMLVTAKNAASAQTILWGDLKPGAFEVGFKVMRLKDHSTATPLQVSIWYPAKSSANLPRSRKANPRKFHTTVCSFFLLKRFGLPLRQGGSADHMFF